MSPPVAAVDFETTYDKVVSIKPLGWSAYFRHEWFEAYLVAIKTSEGFEWVGHPKEAPWDKIKDHIWISHNAAFDENLYYVAAEEGWWGDLPFPPEWHCTMDLAAYSGVRHSLKNASKDVFNADLSKEVRTNMVGQRPPDGWPCVNEVGKHHWKPMGDEFWKDVLDYALDDSVWCLKLWEALSPGWPEQERWLSSHTRKIARRGVPVDIDLVQQSSKDLKRVIHAFELNIPWREEDALLSRKAFDRECAKHSLDPPKSLAQDDSEAEQWLEENEPGHAWIYAYRNWRKANALLKKVEAVERATRWCDGHYRYFGGMAYCGAHTKRWSGKGGNLNMQNPPKGVQTYEMGDVSASVRFRDFFRAPEGFKLGALDLSQIEVRTLTWLSGDTEMLDRIKKSPDIYQAFAEGFGMWSKDRGVLKDVDNNLRQTIKPIVLGSGFGASAWAFADKERYNLQREVQSNYPGGFEEPAKEWMRGQLSEKGTWWWKKAGRLIKRNAVTAITKETASGKEYETPRPQWKIFARVINKLDKKLERGARVPINIDEWDWDYENVLILKEAEGCVQLYRNQMGHVTRFWKKLNRLLNNAVLDNEMELVLPSGNKLRYKNVRKVTVEDGEDKRPQIFCTIVRNGQSAAMKPWYGLLAENLSQSLARDVFAVCLRKLEEAGFRILFHVHDEVIVELPEERAIQKIKEAEEIMRVPPDWIPSLPVDAEGNVGDTYAECK
tara:strand:- start:4943 stop:7108 length:2166 start_codon:yes stop_codon:yes gene_type:complete